MKQLTGMDHMFVQMERGHLYAHVAGLYIYDPSTAPGGKVRFKDILNFFSARIEQFPQFRRRLVEVPLSLDRPYWVEDPEFDVEFHVRHIALPHPGDWRQFCIQVARLHSRPLDPSKPMWEVYVIEGLQNIDGPPPGSFALYMKFHHALFDGEAATAVLTAVHSTSPELSEDSESGPSVRYADRDPTSFEVYSRALVHNMLGWPKLARFMFNTATGLIKNGASSAVADPSKLKDIATSLVKGDLAAILPVKPPQTRFAGRISAHRVFDAVGLSMADIKTIRQQVPGVTVTDVFMAVVGGALRKYLAAKKELPDSSVRAVVPMSLRGTDKTGEGNRVGFMVASVHTDIDDPVARLRAAQESGEAAKRSSDVMGKDFVMNMLEAMPAPLAELMHRGLKIPGMSLCVSSVRGPDVPLYLAGARMVMYLPISLLMDGVALNCTGLSYNGTLWVGALSCREIMPDPAFFVQCLRDSFEDMKAAAAESDKLSARKPKSRKPSAARATRGSNRKANGASSRTAPH